MENKIWRENLVALEAMLPGWKEYIENKEYQETEEYRNRKKVELTLEKSYTGEDISIVWTEEKKYYLAGKYNPNGTAEFLCKNIEKADFGTVVLVIGFSDGRTLRELVNIVSKDTVILVYEPSIDIFLHTLQEYDVTDIFVKHTMALMIEGINGAELKPTLDKAIMIENISKLKTIIQSNYDKLFCERVKWAVSVLDKRVVDIMFLWNTCVEFTNETIYNTIKNFKYLYGHYTLNALLHTLPENVPVIVVAAGPSLDKNIELLKEAKGKACIIACDTALKPLLRRDIVPDFFVVVDPRKPLELFDEPRIQQIPMIAGLNIPYKVMERHQGKKIFCFDTAYASDLLKYVFREKAGGEKQGMAGLATGGSVATSAYSAGIMMGAKTIILVGQDLALSKEKEHAEGTFQKDRTFDLKNKSLPLVDGIDGGKIPTLQNLKLYLEWFEAQIKIHTSVKVVDATEGGALIHGSEVLTLRDAIDTYCIGNFDEAEYWKGIEPHFNEQERERAILFMRKIPKELEKIEKQVVQGKTLYKKLEHIAAKKNYSLEEVKKVLKKVKKITQEIEQSHLAMLIMDGLKGVEYTLRVTAYQFLDDEQKNLMEGAQAGHCFMESMEVAIKEVMPEIIRLSEFQGKYEIAP